MFNCLLFILVSSSGYIIVQYKNTPNTHTPYTSTYTRKTNQHPTYTHTHTQCYMFGCVLLHLTSFSYVFSFLLYSSVSLDKPQFRSVVKTLKARKHSVFGTIVLTRTAFSSIWFWFWFLSVLTRDFFLSRSYSA